MRNLFSNGAVMNFLGHTYFNLKVNISLKAAFYMCMDSYFEHRLYLAEKLILNITAVSEIPVTWRLLNEPKSGILKKHFFQRFEFFFYM